jgi:lipopolysaccharide/colanic/teichoic acid biosynthesis glycosyltransferase
MTLVPKREYVALLLGDIVIFAAALWLTLALRYLDPPSGALFWQHLVPFSLLFVAWVAVFFLAGLYGRHTPLFRSRLLTTIFSAQMINIVIAAMFFFLIPAFGIAPKTVLVLYLFVSSVLVFLWRVALYPKIRSTRRLKGVLIASGADAKQLADEIARDGRYPFAFDYVIDTKEMPSHEVIQKACRVAVEEGVTFLVVDFSDKAVAAALPIIYDAAFHKTRFALMDVVDLYQEIFEREPLSLITYEWVLGNVSSSRAYDVLKRCVDILGALVVGLVSLVVYPFVIFAIKMEDNGPIFVTLPRVGRYQQQIDIFKFRSMTGNDAADYGQSGKSKLEVTKVGKWIRLFRIDEFPQLWNILKGDLSFVGPRPEAPTLAAKYNARIPYYNARHLIQPGLTGWAQLRHDRHPHHGLAVEETKEKLSYDLYYLKHRSLLLDVFVMLQTVRVVLSARGS